MRRDKRESICEATVRVRVGDQIAHTVAEGDGPVNALDGALRLALVKFFPSLEAVELTDYKVRIINGTTGTGGAHARAHHLRPGRPRMGHRRRE